MPDRAVRRRVLSQNFLVDRRAIDALVDGSGAGAGDLVVDIGAGNGLISAALVRRGAQVLAVERDPSLAERLRAKFATWPAVTVVEADVLETPWPAEPFRVVANIPFGITTKILRHLLDSDVLARADVIVQAEVARKRGTAGRGTLLNACWEPWFEFGTGARIPAAAFRPRPRVDAAMLIVTRRASPAGGPWRPGATTRISSRPRSRARGRPWRARWRARSPGPGSRGSRGELGFGADALPSQLDVHQWAGLFRAAGPLRAASAARAPASAPARGAGPRRGRRRAGDRPVP